MKESTAYCSANRDLRNGALILSALAVSFGVLHFLMGDIKVGGVYWLNLDKERNLPTWFTGLLLLGMSCTALVAWYLERERQTEGAIFRLPVLWLGIAAIFAYFALDETTILHENLFWREVREVSVSMGSSWAYMTQWQVLFSPAILLAITYFIIFFFNRYRLSKAGQRIALAGIGCWILAIGLESIRGILLQGESGLNYELEVAVEEVCEMLGAILLLTAMLRYVLELKLDFNEERKQLLSASPALLSRRALRLLTICLGVLAIIGLTAFAGARHLARERAPVPDLIKKAVPDLEHGMRQEVQDDGDDEDD